MGEAAVKDSKLNIRGLRVRPVVVPMRLPLQTSIGAVSIKGLQGENLANALMKAETKAKRRVTLSLAGLGWLDETENVAVEHVPVSVESGEMFSDRVWTKAELTELLKQSAQTVKDLAPILGVDASLLSKDNYPDYIDRWLGEEEGRDLASLVGLAEDYHTTD